MLSINPFILKSPKRVFGQKLYVGDNLIPDCVNFETLFNVHLDFALLRLKKQIGNRYGWLQLNHSALSESPVTVRIIQYPSGRSREIVRKGTEVVKTFNQVIHYYADTEEGSSGSPVFSKNGDRVIAMHHAYSGRYNEGILASEIYSEIKPLLESDD